MDFDYLIAQMNLRSGSAVFTPVAARHSAPGGALPSHQREEKLSLSAAGTRESFSSSCSFSLSAAGLRPIHGRSFE
jgi:hypothetical protein